MRRGSSKLSEKKRLAFVNIPDASKMEIEQLASQFKEANLNLPYKIVFIGGKQWKTLSQKEIIDFLTELNSVFGDKD